MYENRWLDPRTLALLGAGAGMLDPNGGMSQGFRNAMQGLQTGQEYQNMDQIRRINAAQHNYNMDLGKRKLTQLDQMNALFGNMENSSTPPVHLQGVPLRTQAKGLQPRHLEALMALRASGGPDLLPFYKTKLGGVKQEAGQYYNYPTGEREFLPQPIPGATMTPNMEMQEIPNASQINAQFKGEEREAEERARAKHDLVTSYDPVTDNQVNISREQALNASQQGQRLTAVKRPEDVQYDTALAKDSAKHYTNLQNADLQSPGKIEKFKRLQALLKNHDGGKLSKLGVDIASAANSLGMKVDKNLPNKEAAKAITFELATQLRDTSMGGGLPGAISDYDAKTMMEASPSLEQSKEGREKLIETHLKLLDRQREVARMSREWSKRIGRLHNPDSTGKTFYDYLQQYATDNPVFDENFFK